MTPYENVTFKERLHEEAAKLKEMSFRDKFWYIWEYYKFPIIGVVIVRHRAELCRPEQPL